MNPSTQCGKCQGAMEKGRLQTVGNYGNSPIVWAPDNEPSFQVAGSPSVRKDITVYRCSTCGYLEWWT